MKRRNFLALSLATMAPLFTAGRLSAAEKPITLGIFPRRNVRLTYRLFSPMAAYLTEITGYKVILQTAKSFRHFWNNVKAGQYDIVHFNQYHYIVSHLHYDYDVFAVNKELGKSTIAGSIIVRRDSGINSISGLKGKTVLFGGSRRAMQSYIAATWLLRQGGLQAGDYIEKFAINPPNTIISTFFRRADASGSGDVVMQLDNVRKRIDISQLKFLAKTKPMVHLPWAIRNSLPDNMKQTIKNELIAMQYNDAGKTVLKQANLDALVPATDPDFNGHRKIIVDVYGNDYGISRLK